MSFALRAAVFAVACAVTPAILFAQSQSKETLVRRIDSLERRVTELERRLVHLEAPVQSAPSRGRATPGNSRDLANWRRLREGMTYDEVRAILGEPERINGGGIARWTYPRGGEVSFVSGRLSRWEEPGR